MATTRLGLSQPSGTDLISTGDNIISADNVILDKAALITSGLFSARPTAATVGALNYYLATDTSQLFISTGAAFIEVAPGAGTLPIGSLAPWTGSADPADTRWVIADGRALSTTTYATLYGLAGFGNAYDTKDGQAAPGAGLFRIPKMGGIAVIGAGSNTGLTTRTLGQRVGEEVHQQTVAELATHEHAFYVGTGSGGSVVAPGEVGGGFSGAAKQNTWKSGNDVMDTTGSNTPFNVVQPSLALNYIIRIS